MSAALGVPDDYANWKCLKRGVAIIKRCETRKTLMMVN